MRGRLPLRHGLVILILFMDANMFLVVLFITILGKLSFDPRAKKAIFLNFSIGVKDLDSGALGLKRSSL